jgi:hypothetical protein
MSLTVGIIAAVYFIGVTVYIGVTGDDDGPVSVFLSPFWPLIGAVALGFWIAERTLCRTRRRP